MNIKLFIATPAFDGKVHVPFALSLAETTVLLAKNHIQVEYRVVTSGSLLCAERNRLVESFLESDCTHMLCIDSDLGWPAQAVLALLARDEDFVAGVYPSRVDRSFTFRAALQENGSVATNNEKHLLKMEYIPAGFMLVKRCVFERIQEKFPDLKFVPKAKEMPQGHAYFNTVIRDGEFWGEDYQFCYLARESGTEIWVDPAIQFDHGGVIGSMTQVLTDKPPEQTKG